MVSKIHLLHRISVDERRIFMITEEMLRKAAARSCEIYVAHLEEGYDPQNQHEFSPEFEKRIQDLIDGKMPGRLNALRRFIKRLLHHLRVPKRQ